MKQFDQYCEAELAIKMSEHEKVLSIIERRTANITNRILDREKRWGASCGAGLAESNMLLDDYLKESSRPYVPQFNTPHGRKIAVNVNKRRLKMLKNALKYNICGKKMTNFLIEKEQKMVNFIENLLKNPQKSEKNKASIMIR